MNAVAEYWDRQPCNIKHSSSPAGTIYWDLELSIKRYMVEPHIRPFAEFEMWRGKYVLEIGCGIGSDGGEFVSNGADYCGIDISPKSVEVAVKRGVPCAVANAETEQLFRKYDLIYSFGVIHHAEHPEKIIANARRWVKPDGEFRLMLYAKWSLKNLFGQQYEAQAGCPIVRKYTSRSARKLLKGFRVVSIQKRFIFPYKVEPYKRGQYVKHWYFKLMPKWFERILGQHLLIMAKPA